MRLVLFITVGKCSLRNPTEITGNFPFANHTEPQWRGQWAESYQQEGKTKVHPKVQACHATAVSVLLNLQKFRHIALL